jgi:hypothetical protein
MSVPDPKRTSHRNARYCGASQFYLLSRGELVAERAARRALHDSSVAGEGDFAAARRGNVEIGLAYQ